MSLDVRQFVLGCECCQTRKLIRVKTRLPLIISDTPTRAFHEIYLDFYGPLKLSERNNKYILSVQDWLTKFTILIPTQTASAIEVARALTKNVIAYFGPPRVIVTDQGTHFQNRLLQEFTLIFKIDKYCSSAFHPQSQGGMERMHSTLTEHLKQFIEKVENWDEWTALCPKAYNTTKHEVSKFTPHELVFGHKARTLSSVLPTDPLQNFGYYLDELTGNLTRKVRLVSASDFHITLQIGRA